MCSIQTFFIFLMTVLCVLFSINLQFQKQSRPQSKAIIEVRVWWYIPHNALAGQQFVFWNNNEPEHTLLSVVRLLVQYSKYRNRLIALRCYTHFIWALSVMIALKISVFCAKAEVERIQFAARLCASLCDRWNFNKSMWRCLFLASSIALQVWQ